MVDQFVLPQHYPAMRSSVWLLPCVGMIDPGTGVRVYVVSGVTDMREGFRGLAVAAEQAEERGETDDQAESDNKQGKKKRGCKKLPAHLTRERCVFDPREVCPECGGELRLLSEDINDLLDYVSAKPKVL